MTAKKIALIGECMIELNSTTCGHIVKSYGGDVLNSAVYLARATERALIEVYFVSAMGTDALSKAMITHWQEEGINTDLVLIDSLHQPGLYLIQLDKNGERTFLYWRNDSAARYLCQHPHYPMLYQQLAQMDVIYLSGISLAILPAADRKQLLIDLNKLCQQGIILIFDSNYRPALWRNKEDAQACYQAIYAMTDIALVTDDDEAKLWGDKSRQMTLGRLKKAGVKQAIVKAGSQGCDYSNLTSDELMITSIPALPITNIVDTTAAGDAFNAGFIAGYLNGKEIEVAAKMGHQLAGMVIQHQGAIIPKEATDIVTQQFLYHEEK